jgi:predicted transglutaminase-like protease
MFVFPPEVKIVSTVAHLFLEHYFLSAGKRIKEKIARKMTFCTKGFL